MLLAVAGACDTPVSARATSPVHRTSAVWLSRLLPGRGADTRHIPVGTQQATAGRTLRPAFPVPVERPAALLAFDLLPSVLPVPGRRRSTINASDRRSSRARRDTGMR